MQKLTSSENALLGTAAGLCEITVLQPTLFWKNMLMMRELDKYPGMKKFHPRYVYRGYASSATNMAVLTGIQFGSCGYMTKLFLKGEERPLSFVEASAAGFFGGAVSGPVCCFLELIMIQQQLKGGTLPGTIARLYKSHGLMAYTRGLVGSSLREGLYTMGYLGFTPWLGSFLAGQLPDQSDFVTKSAAALIGAIVSGTLSHPVDTFKTCMQGDIERETYGSVRATIKTIHAESGMGGFFRGWFWRVPGRQFPSFFLLNEFRERLAPVLFPEYFGDEE